MCPIIVSLSLSVSTEWNPIRGKLRISKKAESRFFSLHAKFPWQEVVVAFVKLGVSSLHFFVSWFLSHTHMYTHTGLISHHLSQLSLFSAVYPNVRNDTDQLVQWNSLTLSNTWNSTNQLGYLLGAQGLACCIHASVCVCWDVRRGVQTKENCEWESRAGVWWRYFCCFSSIIRSVLFVFYFGLIT